MSKLIFEMNGSAKSDVIVKDLAKVYRKSRALDGISLQIKQGEVYGLIGPNGAGKSTALKILMQMIPPTSGHVTLLGEDLKSSFHKVHAKIGYVPELHFFYRWMTVQRTIEFAKAFYPTWNSELGNRLLKQFDLEPGKKVKQLSKGMQAKLALLLAIAHEPRLLILDEPLSGMDPIIRDEFLEGVMQVVTSGKTTIIFSSHSISDVQRIADVVGILYLGKMVVQKPLEHLVAESKCFRFANDPSSSIKWLPDKVICDKQNGRERSLVISEFSPEVVGQFQSRNRIDHLDVVDLNLEDIFKAYISGAKDHEATSA